MKIELKANGKTVQVEISEEQLKELGIVVDKRDKTGYERVKNGEIYYIVDIEDNAMKVTEYNDQDDERGYDTGNYYNDVTITNNNARADRLLRRLRRWQALNDKPISKKIWKDKQYTKYTISYDYTKNTFEITRSWIVRCLNNVYFTSEEKAKEAMNTFKNELLWYFKEYQQRLDEE